MANVKPLVFTGNYQELSADDYLQIPRVASAPAGNAPAGFVLVYVLDADGHVYTKDSAGTITDLSAAGGGGGLTAITGTAVLNFGNEEDAAVITIANASITNANLKTVAFIPVETTATSLDDFKLNGVVFNIENIIDNTSFDIRGTAMNRATGNYTINYIINI